ncbi:MAG: sugar phosphate nucleotidyltransferase [Patescibacteria group bacterium]|jgi:mannose-1-phosphate guanylyltransferase
MNPVIICGGIGSKMWPVSRSSCPKHFAKLLGNKSLFQLNYEALRLKFRAEEIFVQTNEEQAKIAQEQVPEIPQENYFIEPEMRNQGPATGFAAAMLFKKFPDEPFMLVQADVLREPAEKFIEMIELFDRTIKSEGRLMTAGLKPDYAVMGVDYLIVDPESHRMQEWLGRGEKEVIESYLADGKALIHTNHYAWTPRGLLECLKERKPEWYEPLMNIVQGGNIAEEYAKMPKGPIEEVTQFELKEGLVIELPFVWRDFGTWESLAAYLGKRPADFELDSNNNFVWKSDRYVATIGVEDLVIVDTPDALLIMKKSDSGKVGQVVDKLKEEGRGELL